MDFYAIMSADIKVAGTSTTIERQYLIIGDGAR